MGMSTSSPSPKAQQICWFDAGTQPHPATIRLSYQNPNEPRKRHYTLCADHVGEFSPNWIARTEIKPPASRKA